MFPHTHHKEMVLLFERVVDAPPPPPPLAAVDEPMPAEVVGVTTAVVPDPIQSEAEGTSEPTIRMEDAPSEIVAQPDVAADLPANVDDDATTGTQ